MKRPSLVLVACILSGVTAVSTIAVSGSVSADRDSIDNNLVQNSPSSPAKPRSISQITNSVKAQCASTQKDNWGNCVAADRRVVSVRASANDKDDVSADFEKGMKEANNGGLLKLLQGKTYIIGKKLDLSFLNDVYVQLEGEIKFTDDIKYWQANNFYHHFQKSITFWKWGGKDIKIFGGGTMNGNGQTWWDAWAGHGDILDKNNNFYRPILLYANNVTNFEVSNIKFLDSPCWTTFFTDSNNIVFDRCRFDSVSKNNNKPKNTDGFDSYNVNGLTVTNSEINVGDDCVSPKPNTTNIHVENVWCNGTHGISMGSIGQYPGTLDYITNAYIKNVTLVNGQVGARLKAWAGPNVGYGYIRNITYEDIRVENVDHPIVLDQCYININAATCAKYPSRVNISDVKFINIRGTSSGKLGNVVAELQCSPGAECKNIELRNVDVRTPKNKDQKGLIVCDGIKGGVGVECVTSAQAKKMKNPKPAKMNER